MAKEEEKKVKVKRPTALKRDLQHTKKRDANKAFKSQVRTALRRYEESLKLRDNAATRLQLNEVFSLMDKGVKRGVYKLNKASRTKARSAAKLAKL